jgi:hypothetical protein
VQAGAQYPGPCILFVAVKYGRVGATDRLRPWSTKVEKTAKKSNGRRAFLFEKREPEQLPGPLPKKLEGSSYLQGRAEWERRRELYWTP